MARNGYKVFDSDMHVYDAQDLYEKYMNPKWGDRIPVGKDRSKHGRIEFSLGNGTVLRPRNQVLQHGEDKVADRYGYALEHGYDAPSQVVAMDNEGLDVAVMFRTSPLHCDDSFEPEYANDLCRAWNSWIADFCSERPERMKASGLLTLHDVDMAVDEARRAVTELGVVGLSVCPEPVNGRRIHDRHYDPLWAEVDRLKVPLCFHPPANPKQKQVAREFYGHPNSSVIAMALRNPIELQLAVSAFCGGGVLEKFPTLKVAFLEGNCAWLPWLLYRLDERAELPRRPSRCTSVPEAERVLPGPVLHLRGRGRVPRDRRHRAAGRRQHRHLHGLSAPRRPLSPRGGRVSWRPRGSARLP